jgi:hypothetical protein
LNPISHYNPIIAPPPPNQNPRSATGKLCYEKSELFVPFLEFQSSLVNFPLKRNLIFKLIYPLKK